MVKILKTLKLFIFLTTIDLSASEPNVKKPQILPWNPSVAATKEYPITEYQPLYFVAESLADAKVRMRQFCENLPRPFFARYNSLTNSIWVDRAVRPASAK